MAVTNSKRSVHPLDQVESRRFISKGVIIILVVIHKSHVYIYLFYRVETKSYLSINIEEHRNMYDSLFIFYTNDKRKKISSSGSSRNEDLLEVKIL